MSRVKLTVSVTLAAVSSHMGWTDKTVSEMTITYIQFKKIMMDILELANDDGTCRQRWNDLVDCGYFKAKNRDEAVADLSRIRERLSPEEVSA